jgi:hypothetical protein
LRPSHLPRYPGEPFAGIHNLDARAWGGKVPLISSDNKFHYQRQYTSTHISGIADFLP